MNTQITEDYVSFETAKLLKEKGFEEETCGYYPIKGNGIGLFRRSGVEYNHNHSQVQISAPTHQMAMKWLREVHNCIITCWWEFENYVDGKPDFSNIVWSYNIAIPKYNSARKGNGDYFDMDSERENYLTYEEACEAAIKYCLTNLI